MTTTTATISPAPSVASVPLARRILAAFNLKGSVRAAVALLLLDELMALGVNRSTLSAWSKIGSLLATCSTTLAVAGEARQSAHFAKLARQSMELWEAARAEMCGAVVEVVS